MNNKLNLAEAAHALVVKEYDRIGLMYGDKTYVDGHLRMVVDYVDKYGKMCFVAYTSNIEDILRAVAWCHDIMEEPYLSYNDVKKYFHKFNTSVSQDIAENIFLLTPEKGRNRSERYSDSYYENLKRFDSAVFIKICDRLANTKFSKENGSKQFQMYKDEYEHFRQKIYNPKFIRPILELDKLVYE